MREKNIVTSILSYDSKDIFPRTCQDTSSESLKLDTAWDSVLRKFIVNSKRHQSCKLSLHQNIFHEVSSKLACYLFRNKSRKLSQHTPVVPHVAMTKFKHKKQQKVITQKLSKQEL